MTTYRAVTVPTRFVEGSGIRFAYRRYLVEGRPFGRVVLTI